MRLQGKKIVSLVHSEFEDLELWYPILRLQEEGAIVHLAGEEINEKYIGKIIFNKWQDFFLRNKIFLKMKEWTHSFF